MGLAGKALLIAIRLM